MAADQQWEIVQKKTFTKWCNNHLNKAYGDAHKVEDILADWKNGILLIHLAVCLYNENEKNPEMAISLPKLSKRELEATSRIAMAANCNKALDLLKTAGVKLRVSAENLMDEDKVNILGMVWMIILDYAARGFGGTPAELKKALLEWVNKKCDGYERVNPPSVKNFHKDWRSGLAWCALIHRHRPELIDYQQCLGQSNAENLEQAFSVAEEHLGIPRLLDVEDVDVEKPDDKSVMTYVMEYFNAFAGEGLKEAAAKQAADWLQFLREIRNRQNDYNRRAGELIAWVQETEGKWAGEDLSTCDEAASSAAFDGLKDFVGQQKPSREVEKMDCEALFAEIQTILSVNNLQPFVPDPAVSPDALTQAFLSLNSSQSKRGEAVREAKFRFIEKKEDNSEEETLAEIRKSFDNYDANSNGVLNKVEFNAACMELGIVMKSQEEKDEFFNKISEGAENVSFEQFRDWMLSRMSMKMDSAASAKSVFATIADGRSGLTEASLSTPPLTAEDKAFIMENCPKTDDGLYDYASFVDQMMK